MDALWFEILGVVILIALIGFFSASEVAVLSTRKSRMQEISDDGNKKASFVLNFQSHPEQFLATIHVGVIFSLTLAAGLGGIIGFQYLVPALSESQTRWISESSSLISLGIIGLGIGTSVVVFGELVPKSLALRFPEQVALRVAGPIQILSSIFSIPVKFLTWASNVMLMPFKDTTSFTESRISENEFKLMLEEGTKTGVIDKTEHELIESIFEFTDTTAKEVMIPRPDVVALNVDAPREIAVRKVLEEGYSRMPVYKGTIDNIIGIMYTKDILGLMEYKNVIIIHDILRPAYFVPETKKISQLMRELQQRKMHMAVVIDEFGGTAGIITMEDILEEIVGEIHDEYDEEVKDVETTADGTYLVNARISIREFMDRFLVDLPEADEYETMSGFLQKQTGRIPELNEEIHYNNLAFTVIKKSQRRIRLLRYKKLPTASANNYAEQSGSVSQ
ncbi:MAG: HlyC/CorC family transporter [Ignavibacteriae bacterium]|nr:HlyC/CorC family transporter [Ignavibacteriota bacterium]